MLTRITTTAFMLALLGTTRTLVSAIGEATRKNELNNNMLANNTFANNTIQFDYPILGSITSPQFITTIDLADTAVGIPAPTPTISYAPINKYQPTTTKPLTEKFISQFVSAPAAIKKELIKLIYDIYNSDPIYHDYMTLAFHTLPGFAIAAYTRKELKKPENVNYYWATHTIIVPSDVIDGTLPHYLRLGFKRAAAHATQLILGDSVENLNYCFPNTETEMFKVDQMLRLGEERLARAKTLLLSSADSAEKRKIVDLQNQAVLLTPHYIHYGEFNADDLKVLKRTLTLRKDEKINLDKVDKATKKIRGNIKIVDVRQGGKNTIIEFQFLDLVGAMINKILGNVASIKAPPHFSINERAMMLFDGFPPILVKYFYPEFYAYQQSLFSQALSKAMIYRPLIRDAISFDEFLKFDNEIKPLSRIAMRARHLKQYMRRVEDAYSLNDDKWMAYIQIAINFAVDTSHLLPFNYHDIFYRYMKNPYSENSLQEHLLLVAEAVKNGLLTDADAKVEEQFNEMIRENRIKFLTSENIDSDDSISEEKINFYKKVLNESASVTTNATTNATVSQSGLKR